MPSKDAVASCPSSGMRMNIAIIANEVALVNKNMRKYIENMQDDVEESPLICYTGWKVFARIYNQKGAFTP